MATYLGKIPGGKSFLGVHVAKGAFGEVMRFYCHVMSCPLNLIDAKKCTIFDHSLNSDT